MSDAEDTQSFKAVQTEPDTQVVAPDQPCDILISILARLFSVVD